MLIAHHFSLLSERELIDWCRKVAASFLGQGVLKQVLTEGERYVMTVLSLLSLAEQGIYDVVSNLGSLAARCVSCATPNLVIKILCPCSFNVTVSRDITFFY